MKDIIKNNILAIVCGIVVLIALIVPFFPMGGYESDLQGRLQSRVGVYNNLQGQLNKSRMTPVLDPDGAEATPLGRFPNDEIIAAGEAAKAAFEAESQRLMQLVIDLNRKQPLVPGSLPRPQNQALAFQFRTQYRNMIEQGIARIMNAGAPPTPEQLKTAEQELWNTRFQPLLAGVGSGPAAQRMQQLVQQDFQAAVLKLPEQERQRIAQESKVYLEPGALTVYPAILQGTALPDPADIWYAQLQLWVQEDTARAIAKANAEATNVQNAPVKQVVRIEVPPFPYVFAPGTPGAPLAEGDQSGTAVPTAPTLSLTGRHSNPMYDVVHYDLIMNVRAADVARIMQELTADQLVTVLRANMTSLDSAALRQQGYYYGNDPVVQLSVRLEKLFLRDWTTELMPEAVKQRIGGTPEGGDPGMYPGMGPGMPMF